MLAGLIEERPETRGERWARIYEPITGQITGAQEDWVRAFAAQEGYENLRGYWKHIQTDEWDFWEIYREIYNE